MSDDDFETIESRTGIRVRRATVRDVPVITEFNVCLAMETESRRLDTEVVRRGVQRAFDQDLGASYLVAESAGRVVGQLLTTREWSDWHDAWYLWLQSVYVRADMRGRGVFRRLMEHVFRIAADAGDVCAVRLYVEYENAVAIETYRRLGFSDGGYRVLEAVVEKPNQKL